MNLWNFSIFRWVNLLDVFKQIFIFSLFFKISQFLMWSEVFDFRYHIKVSGINRIFSCIIFVGNNNFPLAALSVGLILSLNRLNILSSIQTVHPDSFTMPIVHIPELADLSLSHRILSDTCLYLVSVSFHLSWYTWFYI